MFLPFSVERTNKPKKKSFFCCIWIRSKELLPGTFLEPFNGSLEEQLKTQLTVFSGSSGESFKGSLEITKNISIEFWILIQRVVLSCSYKW